MVMACLVDLSLGSGLNFFAQWDFQTHPQECYPLKT